MSSILTNTSAMVALETLKGINASLQKTQMEISTGKSVATAKDNAAVWAISKVMNADVVGFKAITSSLNLGESTVAVGRKAAEKVTEQLTNMKEKIVAAQESNVDRGKIQADIAALRDQIKSVVSAAQFNGLNLIQGYDDVDILSSLDRAGDGTVSTSHITVQRQDLSMSKGANGVGVVGAANLSAQMVDSTGATYAAGTADNTGNTAVIQFGSAWTIGQTTRIQVGDREVTLTAAAAMTDAQGRDALLGQLSALDMEGVSFSASSTNQIIMTSDRGFENTDLKITDAVANRSYIQAMNGTNTGNTTTQTGKINQQAEEVFFSTANAPTEDNSYEITLGTDKFFYSSRRGDTFEDVARGLKTAIDSAGLAGISTKVAVDKTTGQASIKILNEGASATLAVTTAAADKGKAAGGLYGLDTLDVTTKEGAALALDNVERMIQTSIDSAAAFGSAQGRIQTQSSFVDSLMDALKTGIGSMVDADMEAASAQLQALQVHQQLGVQSLSIANQAPQSILSLFR